MAPSNSISSASLMASHNTPSRSSSSTPLSKRLLKVKAKARAKEQEMVEQEVEGAECEAIGKKVPASVRKLPSNPPPTKEDLLKAKRAKVPALPVRTGGGGSSSVDSAVLKRKEVEGGGSQAPLAKRLPTIPLPRLPLPRIRPCPPLPRILPLPPCPKKISAVIRFRTASPTNKAKMIDDICHVLGVTAQEGNPTTLAEVKNTLMEAFIGILEAISSLPDTSVVRSLEEKCKKVEEELRSSKEEASSLRKEREEIKNQLEETEAAVEQAKTDKDSFYADLVFSYDNQMTQELWDQWKAYIEHQRSVGRIPEASVEPEKSSSDPSGTAQMDDVEEDDHEEVDDEEW